MLVGGRTMLEIDRVGERNWGLWTIDAMPPAENVGLPAEYVEIAAGEPRSETVRQ